ncbi:glycosyltransferase family 1 protein [Lophiostoma macrostomum CBS 122681]|uniref:Glycosyltransferase family 1 protein n=1 Tax=Lophiostoma macrostomum CBS 122681 TaxID=1314788 RepID=A0A6A6SR88_9PLEO|nr:glycosyltransferase family 1 protein [Lophiostoma macrostomum CBS 122681]
MTSVTHWSHYEKNAAIALELATLGYPVTFMTGGLLQEDVSNLHPNIKFSAMLGPDAGLREEDIQTWLSLPAGRDRELFIEKKIFIDTLPDGQESEQVQFRQFRKRYGNKKPLIFLHDQAATGHYPVLLGGPGIRPDASVGISLSPLSFDSNDTFPFRLEGVPRTGPDAKEVHRKAYQAYYEDKYVKELNEYWWAQLRNMGVARDTIPPMLHAMNSLSDYLVTLGIPQFEFPRSDLRPNVLFCGALKKVGKMGAKEPELPPWWNDIAQAKKEGKKIIAVSQGTAETNLEHLVLPTLEALKDREDVLVIATFVVAEPEDIPNLVVPGNVRVAKFVPYDQLLPLVDVLVSNGGYGAVLHALRLGIPMVVAGMGQEKETTNSIIEWSGVGINLKVRDPGTERLAAAVATVLEDPAYNTKVKELSREFDKYDVGQVFDEVIQEIVQNWKNRALPFRQEL